MTEDKKYRLVKDALGVTSGTVFKKQSHGLYSCFGCGLFVSSELVLNQEYFKEIHELEKGKWYDYNSELIFDDLPFDEELLLKFGKDTPLILAKKSYHDSNFLVKSDEGLYVIEVVLTGFDSIMVINN